MSGSELDRFSTFGELLRHLRQRARLTQRELGVAVGYSDAHITRLEAGQRQPDPSVVRARFIEALDLRNEPALAHRLIELAEVARAGPPDEPDIAAASPAVPDPADHPRPAKLSSPLSSFAGREGACTLEIHLLGGFRMMCDGVLFARLNTPRMQSLLAYLLVHRHTPHSRQRLAFALWPDSTEPQARTNLRKLLHELRQILPEFDRYLHAEGSSIQWRTQTPMELDVAQFQDALDQASRSGPAAQALLERAVALYEGDLLPDCYDDWIAPEREQLSHRFSMALAELVRLCEGRREYRAAITHAQRLLRQDALNEGTYRTLMRLNALDGDHASVERVYQACHDSLARELGVLPDDATRELHEQIMRTRIVPLEDALNQPVALVGRMNEWQRLLRAWDATAKGRGQCVLIVGEAGIGKTRLAEAFGAWAASQGITVSMARCYAVEGALPFAPVVAGLRGVGIRQQFAALSDVWLSEISRLLPELRLDYPSLPLPVPLTEAWQRQRLFEALARTVLAAQPVTLFMDDLHWADHETLEWLHFLLRFDPHARVMVLGTARIEEMAADHPLRLFQMAMQREGGWVEIELDPLSAADTAALAAQITGQVPSPDEVAHLYRETEGVPLFVVESMRDVGESPNAAWYLSPTVQAVIARRLSQLSPGAHELAELAATIGREFTLDVLLHASGGNETALVRGIDELLQRRLIREHASALGGNVHAYDFSHDKIREVAYALLSGVRRRMLHRQAAAALEAVYAGQLDIYSGQIASHCERAGLDDRAIAHYQRAAQVAQRMYANVDAIRDYRSALRLSQGRIDRGLPTPIPLAAIGESLGDVLHFVTRDDEARATYLDALTSADGSDAVGTARLQRKVGSTWRDQRRYEDALLAYQAAELVLDDPVVAEASPEWWVEWIQIQLEKDLVFYWQGQMEASAELHERMRPIIETHGTPGQRATFFQNLATHAFRENRHVATSQMVAYMTAALDALTKAADQTRIPSATFGVGVVLLWQGKPEQARKPMLDALAMAERSGDASLIARCATYLATAFRQLGQVEQTRQFVIRSLEAAQVARMPEYTALAEANAAWIAWRSDDRSGVCDHGQAAIKLWNELPPGHASAPFQWTALFPLIATALRDSDTAQAARYAQSLLDPAMQVLPDALTEMLGQATNAWMQDQPDKARACLEQSVGLARQFHFL